MARPGFGVRHPDLTALLAVSEPVATGQTAWLGGTLPLRVTAFTEPAELPAPLVTSVRCIVWVGELLVLCENVDGRHPWPGGRRNPGERYVETARREVHEETGWLLDVHSVRPLGWLHIEHLTPQPAGHPWPNPDFLQLVLCGTARDRDGDVEGYERSRLVTLEQAKALSSNDLLAPVFLDLF